MSKAPPPTPTKPTHRDGHGRFTPPPHRKQPRKPPQQTPDPTDGGALNFQGRQ